MNALDEFLQYYECSSQLYQRRCCRNSYADGGVLDHQLLEILLSLGLKLAEKGEFTKRAFLNGRIDLTKAEVFPSKHFWRLWQAVNQLQGKLFEKINSFREKIIVGTITH